MGPLVSRDIERGNGHHGFSGHTTKVPQIHQARLRCPKFKLVP